MMTADYRGMAKEQPINPTLDAVIIWADMGENSRNRDPVRFAIVKLSFADMQYFRPVQ